VTDLRGESASTKNLYWLDHEDVGPFGRQCLLARRLAERGVRFVQNLLRRGEHDREKDPPELGFARRSRARSRLLGAVLDTGCSALLYGFEIRAGCSNPRS